MIKLFKNNYNWVVLTTARITTASFQYFESVELTCFSGVILVWCFADLIKS